MAFLTQVITNLSATDPLVLDNKLGGDSIAASGNRTKVVDSDNVDEEYIKACQNHVNKGEASITWSPTSVEEGDQLAAFHKAVQEDLAVERKGTLAFTASASESVALTVEMPDANYVVLTELDADPGVAVGPWIANKTVGGFDIVFDAAVTLNVQWVVKAL
jgi:hypothetical protein